MIFVAAAIALIGIVPAFVHLIRGTKQTRWAAIAGVVAAIVLGFGGTVLGLVGSFHAVETGAADRKAEMLAGGISAAMRCTAGGIAGAAVGGILLAIGVMRGPNGRQHNRPSRGV